MTDLLKKEYRGLFEEQLLNEIEMVGTTIEVDGGDSLIKPGQYIRSIPIVLSGSIKILRPDSEGDELLLYHFDFGSTCAMTLSCCMGQSKSELHAVAETKAKLIMVPTSKMEEWSRKYKSWRNFVFNNYHRRMMELLDSVDNIAFNNLDQRLERWLDQKIEITNSRHIDYTHQHVASELHTNRVVISRLLKKMERQGKIKLNRNSIQVL